MWKVSPKPTIVFFQFAADDVEGGVASGDARATIEEDQPRFASTELVEDGDDLIGFVFDDCVVHEAIAGLLDLFAQILAVDVGFGRARIRDGNDSERHGAEFVGMLVMADRAAFHFCHNCSSLYWECKSYGVPPCTRLAASCNCLIWASMFAL